MSMHITITLTFPKPVSLQALDYILTDLMDYVEEGTYATFLPNSVTIDAFIDTESREEAETALAEFEETVAIRVYNVQVSHQYQEEE